MTELVEDDYDTRIPLPEGFEHGVNALVVSSSQPRPIPLFDHDHGSSCVVVAYAIVDEADADRALAAGPWLLIEKSGHSRTHYAGKAVKGRGRWLMLHRWLLEAKPRTQVDHRDGNGLNNTRDNLRFATTQQNGQNSRKRAGYAQAKTTSPYKGVSWHKRTGCWRATLTYNRKAMHLGYFKDPIEAAKRFDDVARVLHGRFASLNFPKPGERCCHD